MGRRYKVIIRYREPSYERVSGPKAEPYRWTFEMLATDAADAQRRAVGEFRQVERESGVGWAREIEGIDISQGDRL
jgi:hypothetical protein